MNDRKPMSRSQMRQIIVTDVDPNPAGLRAAALADLIRRTSIFLSLQDPADQWAHALDIAGTLHGLSEEPVYPYITALVGLLRRDPGQGLRVAEAGLRRLHRRAGTEADEASAPAHRVIAAHVPRHTRQA
ncbi:hypothetical protein LCGC14_0820510 [marine sediment metagenome]|uniref:Uncharacterized protein n=1 Tax=marine sediment metagenome TaxID=412755 RepID=A0A0F9SRL8_9ZZZZ